MSRLPSEYTIQEASAKLGVPVQKLRRWDSQGVLVARRTEGGHRRYSPEIIDGLAASPLGTSNDKYEDELATARKTLREKRRIIQLLLESESRYRDLVETSHDLIWTTDSHGRFTYLNNGALDIFGLQPKDLLGRCIFDFEARPSHFSNRRFLSTLRRHGEVKNYITHLLAADGSDRWVGINARVSHDDSGQLCGIRGTARNVTEQHEAALQIEYLATHDSLTGLPNRVSLQRTLEHAMQQGDVGAMLFIDIDHFKYVNDNYGHRSGDQLIVGVSGVLKEAIKEFNGQVFRLGGDEYADTSARVAARPGHKSCRAPARCAAPLPLPVGQSAARFRPHRVHRHRALPVPRQRCHRIAVERRHRHVPGQGRRPQPFCPLRPGCAEPAPHSQPRALGQPLREVLDEDRLVLYSQPVVRLADMHIVHCEILVRIRDDNGNIVLPSQFIEHAESLGMVQEIDMRVVERLIEYLRQPENQGQKMRYFVNLSRVSISDQHWVRKFYNMLAASDITQHNQLVFEITETAAMTDVDVTQQFIRELKQLGCRFALDDFGAGFSSFYYLKRFDVDYLKIDGGFIRDLATDDGSNRIFVKALCDVARNLNKQVIAEWVEDREVMKVLTEMGTLYGQGFLFHRPAPLWEEAPELTALSVGE